jgi:hypothetical protein
VILAKTMESPMAFGSACNCDDVPGICSMQRTGSLVIDVRAGQFKCLKGILGRFIDKKTTHLMQYDY